VVEKEENKQRAKKQKNNIWVVLIFTYFCFYSLQMYKKMPAEMGGAS